MKKLVFFLSVVGSAVIISIGAYVVSNGMEFTINGDFRDYAFGWFQQSEKSGDVAPVITDLQAAIEDRGEAGQVLSLSGIVNPDSSARLGDLFIDVDGDVSLAGRVFPAGSELLRDTFGYDYVVAFDYDKLSYQVHSLDGFPDGSAVELQVTEDPVTGEARPFRYRRGGSPVGSGGPINFPHGDATGGAPGAGTPGAGTPGAGTPGAGTPGAGTPGAGTPGAGTPGAGTPGAGTPGGGTPQVELPPIIVEVPIPEDIDKIPYPLAADGPGDDSFVDPSREGPPPDDGMQPVPEPSTWLLLGSGLLAGFLLRNRLR